MSHEFRLADIGEGLEEAEIINWLVKVGDRVSRDQPLIEVMTDKSNAELPAPVSGVVVDLKGAVGDIIHVGGLIAIIDEGASSAALAPPEPVPAPSSPVVEASAVTAAVTAALDSAAEAVLAPAITPVAAAPVDSAPESASGLDRDTETARETEAIVPRPKASPSTRRVALERGIDLAQIVGTGPGGRILVGDLDQTASTQPAPAAPAPVTIAPEPSTAAPEQPAAPAPPATPAPQAPPPAAAQHDELSAGTVPLRGVRRAVAVNMTRAWAEIPHIHAFDHIDAEPMLEMRSRLKETERAAYEALTPLGFFVAAVARALTTFPEANASIDMENQTISTHPAVNVGIAVAAPHGLVVPVLRGADQLPFETLSLTLAALVRGARDGSLSREHFQGGTVTITNFGALGGEQAVPIIRPGESMIFGFGSIAARPFVIDDQVEARSTMHVVCGADHRLHDGDITTQVLNDVGASLTDPLRLVI